VQLVTPLRVTGIADKHATDYDTSRDDHPAGAATCGASAAPTSSAADLSYCAKLSDLYQRYLGPEKSGHFDTTPDVVGGEAVAKCQEGNAAASIPVLERLLTNAGFTLPRRG
jgi:hypothetical protein